MTITAIHTNMRKVTITDHRHNQLVIHIMNRREHHRIHCQRMRAARLFFRTVDVMDLILIDDTDISFL